MRKATLALTQDLRIDNVVDKRNLSPAYQTGT
jgi:hypothetical protein